MRTDRVMEAVKSFFDNHTNHKPSPEIYEALRAIPDTIGNMAEGKALPLAFVSPLDAGVGKSVTLAHAIKDLREQNLGILICLSRYEEIEAAKERMRLSDDDFSVLVTHGRPERKWGLGYERRDEAPILFTTHAMVEKRLEHRVWSEADEFFFKGKPRKLRIWDEAFRPGMVLSVSSSDLHLLCARYGGSKFGRMMRALTWKIEELADYSVLDLEDFADDYDVSALLSKLKPSHREGVHAVLNTLFRLSGRQVRVRHDGPSGNTLVEYEITFPEDFYPVLVLDASARVSGFYPLYEAAQKKARLLPAAQKKYERVTIHFDERGSGKQEFGKRYWETVAEIADLLFRHPDKQALVLSHKQDERNGVGDLEKDLIDRIKQRSMVGRKNVPPFPKVVTWGRHNASNEYSDCNLIITASTYVMPNSTIEGLGRMAAGLRADEWLSANRAKTIRKGELLDTLLQGICRGSLRNLDGDQAQECLVYLRSSKKSGLKQDLKLMFPGAKLKDGWDINAKDFSRTGKLVHQQEQLLMFLEQRFASGALRVNWSEMIEHLGMQKTHFSYRIMKPDFVELLHQMGYEVVKEGRFKAIVVPEWYEGDY